MKYIYNIFLLLVIGGVQCLSAQKSVEASSPDGKIRFSLRLENDAPVYKVFYEKQVIVENSSLSFDFDSGYFGKNLKINKPVHRKIDETYELVVGKNKRVRNQCREVTIPFEEKEKPFRKINLIVRAFNDGVAFRYEFPSQPDWNSYVMYDENSTFNLSGNPQALAMILASYTTSHEGFYSEVPYRELEENRLIEMPATFVFPNGTCLAITEAAIVDYAGMYLMKKDGVLTGKLSPLPGQDKIRVEATLPHKTPWRVMMIGDKINTLMESNILTNLNEPCKIEDTSWIQPGKTTFTWWNGNVVPDTTFLPGNNFQTNKYYIDFAARNQLDFHSIYGYAEQPWYVDDGFDFSNPGKNVDITKSIAPLDMKAICDYARSQGVKIHVWLNWRALYPQIDEAFRQFEEWGVVGMMVDFMDRDDQEMIRIQEEILIKAARHHLFVQFHGSSKPSGLHRTYPNEFTREGTLNYECYKWSTHINADHDIHMPFSRGLAGPADYHLGGFRAVPASEFKMQYTRPLVTSTRCHMLGMYLVLESYLGMLCDFPEAYEGQPGFDFLKKVPTVWDETKVVDARINEYVITARKNNEEWFIGSINNSKARTIDISFDFLDDGEYMADIYTDASDTDVYPDHLEKQTKIIRKKDQIKIVLASGGGAVMHLKKR